MKNENDVRLIDANKFLKWLDVGHLRNPSEICLSEINVKNMIDLQPTIDPESLPIVFELRREIDRLVNDGKQDLWAVERKRREEVEEELELVKKERDDYKEKVIEVCKLCRMLCVESDTVPGCDICPIMNKSGEKK